MIKKCKYPRSGHGSSFNTNTKNTSLVYEYDKQHQTGTVSVGASQAHHNNGTASQINNNDNSSDNTARLKGWGAVSSDTKVACCRDRKLALLHVCLLCVTMVVPTGSCLGAQV